MGKLKNWFHELSLAGKVSVIAVIALSGIFSASAISMPSTNISTEQTNTSLNGNDLNEPDKTNPVIQTETKTDTESVPYESKTIETDDLPKGETKVQTAGVNGEKTITYTITLTDGIETNRTSQESVTKEPTTEIILSGTYVKPIQTSSNCDPNYTGCVPIASDVDCGGGSGNGPAYVYGPVQVIGYDIYDLDRDGDGWGCE